MLHIAKCINIKWSINLVNGLNSWEFAQKIEDILLGGDIEIGIPICICIYMCLLVCENME